MTYPSVEANLDDLLWEEDHDFIPPAGLFRRSTTEPTPSSGQLKAAWAFHEADAQTSIEVAETTETNETRDTSTPSSALTHTPPPEQTFDQSAYYVPLMWVPEGQEWNVPTAQTLGFEWGNATTVMMRNLPNRYTQQALLMDINEAGFIGMYDFLYLPLDTETNANKGYAFINFSEPGFAWMFKQAYEDRKMPQGIKSSKFVSVSAATLQGFDANYKHYFNRKVNRGDPASRPLFLREPTSKPWRTGNRNGRRNRLEQVAETQDLHRQLKSALQSVAVTEEPGQEDATAMSNGQTLSFPSAETPSPEWDDTTTIMMRNLPNKYTQQALLTDINEAGFIGTYDFLYLPVDTATNANKGYAFINFSEPGFAWIFKRAYEDRKMPQGSNSHKFVSVSPATLQGFDANYKHYANTRVNRGDPATRPLFLREPTSDK